MARTSVGTLLSYLRRVAPASVAAGAEDGQLLARFAHGDDSAFTDLMRRHAPLVWGVRHRVLTRTQDVEDAFQATFLILARKARSLAGTGPLGPWLHRVAHRTAAKARARDARCRERETLGAIEPTVESPPDVLSREVRSILDEEVALLPEKYRQPVVLCYMEGLTNEEAARRLACPHGTVRSRLSRAREQLRGRLLRRGLGFPAAVFTGLLGEASASAVPPAVLDNLLRAGPLLRAGAGSASVTTLAEGVLSSMFLSQFKFAGLALLALAVVASGAGLLAQRSTAPPIHPASVARPQAEKSGREERRPDKPEVKQDKAPVTPEEKGPKAKEKTAKDVAKENATPRNRETELRQLLTSTVDYQGLDDPKATFIDELDRLARKYKLTFDVNEQAFKADEVEAVRGLEITGPNPIPPMKTSLARVLTKILSRLPMSCRPMFFIRKDVIEITTERAFRAEMGLPAAKPSEPGQPDAPLLPLVDTEFSRTRLARVLSDLAADNAFSIVIDARVQEKANVPISARLVNAPLDIAVRILADMAGLGVVRMGNLFYITSPENAAKLQPDKPAEMKSTAPARAEKKAPQPREEVAKEEAPRGGREAELRHVLSKTIDYPGLDDPWGALIDELDSLARLHHVTFDVNEDAFKEEKAGNVLKLQIANPNAIPPMKASLATVLTKILSRLPSPSRAMFFLRKDVIEITTERAFRTEMGLPAAKPTEPGQPPELLLPIVREEFHKTPLARVLSDLADGAPFSVVIDPHVEERASVKISPRLANVPLDIAVRVLADMGGLSVVRMGNVFYVTSPENAAKLQSATKKTARKPRRRG